jgi:hypothetical protein
MTTSFLKEISKKNPIHFNTNSEKIISVVNKFPGKIPETENINNTSFLNFAKSVLKKLRPLRSTDNKSEYNSLINNKLSNSEFRKKLMTLKINTFKKRVPVRPKSPPRPKSPVRPKSAAKKPNVRSRLMKKLKMKK